MNFLILEPYFVESHAAWAKGYAHNSGHYVNILYLGGYFWKWRMHGGAVTLAHRFLKENDYPDLLLASDMLDLSTFLALTRHVTADMPSALYFHENQLSYPWSPTDPDPFRQRDKHYGFINYVSALAADHSFFNSTYHRDSFLEALSKFLKKFPDHNEQETVHQIEAKSSVLSLGLDLRRFQEYSAPARKPSEPAAILWNHRWEYDKNPDMFFRVLQKLAQKGLRFELIVLGKSYRRKPDIFAEAEKIFRDKIIRFGHVKSFDQYAAWLRRADILPVTSEQDFFGTSVMEAIYHGCYPLLPKRLSYPDLIPSEFHSNFFYEDYHELELRLEQVILDIENTRLLAGRISRIAEQYDWKTMAPVYDNKLASLVSNKVP